MSTKMLVTVKLDQRLMMSQQLRQAIMLLQYNTLDLKQLVQQTLETNPLLLLDESETDNLPNESENFSDVSGGEDDYLQPTSYSASFSKSNSSYYENEEENSLENFAKPKSLRHHLLEQTLLCQFDPAEQIAAEAIIDALDERGYLTMSLEDIQAAINFFDIDLMRNVLATMQGFDPTGVCVHDLRECLLAQLKNLTERNSSWEIARKILTDYFELIAGNVKKMIKQLGVTHQEYSDAMVLIRSLNPNPGIQFSNDSNINVEPELYVEKRKNTWCVFLTESILTNVKMNNHYQELIKQNKKHGSYEALKKELEEARSLLKGLKRRNETLLAVGSFIIEMQTDFLEEGPQKMKSMNIAEVALALNLHESTISRITTGKYIATPRGVFELKYFFPSYVTTQSGDSCSATAVKAHIKEMILQETGGLILSDGEIAEKLKEKGINIARRTVAKYREAMKILPSYQRQAKSGFSRFEDTSVEVEKVD
ncbi:MAG: RNA polymerase factor sigma-54 [Gammaproteobacteria bacterium]